MFYKQNQATKKNGKKKNNGKQMSQIAPPEEQFASLTTAVWKGLVPGARAHWGAAPTGEQPRAHASPQRAELGVDFMPPSVRPSVRASAPLLGESGKLETIAFATYCLKSQKITIVLYTT